MKLGGKSRQWAPHKEDYVIVKMMMSPRSKVMSSLIMGTLIHASTLLGSRMEATYTLYHQRTKPCAALSCVCLVYQPNKLHNLWRNTIPNTNRFSTGRCQGQGDDLELWIIWVSFLLERIHFDVNSTTWTERCSKLRHIVKSLVNCRNFWKIMLPVLVL